MPIIIINQHFTSLIWEMLQQLQSNMEESQPINPEPQTLSKHQNQARKHKEDTYRCQHQPISEKTTSFMQIFKQKYAQCFTIALALLLVIIIIQIYLVAMLSRQRFDEFERNMKILRENERWEQVEANQLKQKPHPLAYTKRPQQSQHLRRPDPETFELEMQKQVGSLNNQLQSLNTEPHPLNQHQYPNKGWINDKVTSVQVYNQPQPTTPTLNLQYAFESNQNQQNIQPVPISFTADQNMPSLEQQKQAQVFPQVAANEATNKNSINYDSFTGITVDQVSNTLKWMQLKYESSGQNNQIADQERRYYEQKYQISKYGEMPICVVVPTFNNAVQNRHINNINSILVQEYSNYHIIFIDDASTDSTATDVIQILTTQNKLPPNQYTIIRNTQQMKAMHNLRTAALNYCQPQDIFMVIDGDDELIGRQVFKVFNAVFQQSGAWFVYSNFLTANNYVGFSRIVPPNIIANNQYRKHSFVTSHLRAFFTQLFRNVKEEDLRDPKGEYLQAANDVAICFPVLEQAQERLMYIPELTYYYNSDTGLNNHFLRLKEQKRNQMRLRKKRPYKRLDQLFS